LEKLGFPWILSSESSLFSGLSGIFAQRNFARPFAVAAASAGGELAVEAQDCSSGEHNLISGFLQ
jgi:hypothetical protein